MADIFLSYASADRYRARRIAELLQESGWSVWMDRFIGGGMEWHPELQAQLAAARCVVVLWTRDSIQSAWVCDEARTARARNVLLPVLLHPVTPPGELGEVQCVQATSWMDDSNNYELQRVLDHVAGFLGGTAPTLPPASLGATNLLISRIEVAEAVFRFCAARLDFFHERRSQGGVSAAAEEALRTTYGELERTLAPVSSDELHELLGKHENAFTPRDSGGSGSTP